VTKVQTDPDLSGSPSVSNLVSQLLVCSNVAQLLPISHTNSQSKIPSKLRESSVLSSAQVDRHSSSPESRYSSPARSGSASSLQSPVLAGAPPTSKAKSKTASTASKIPAKPYSPPRPPPPAIRLPEFDYLVGKWMLGWPFL
jgi:hypothetical protein